MPAPVENIGVHLTVSRWDSAVLSVFGRTNGAGRGEPTETLSSLVAGGIDAALWSVPAGVCLGPAINPL